MITAYLWTMAAAILLSLIDVLLTRPEHVNPAPPGWVLTLAGCVRTALLVWTVALLTGCGGGGDDPDAPVPDVTTPRITCNTPGVCA